VDITYTGNKSFPCLSNVVSLNEKTLLYNTVGRVLCNKRDSRAHATVFKETERFPDLHHGRSLAVILVDFDATRNDLFLALAEKYLILKKEMR